jgi:hypothetical protein
VLHFDNYLVKNHLLDFESDFAEIFLGWPSTKFLERILIGKKTWPPGCVAVSRMCVRKRRNVPWVALYQIPSKEFDPLKTRLPGGLAVSLICIYLWFALLDHS